MRSPSGALELEEVGLEAQLGDGPKRFGCVGVGACNKRIQRARVLRIECRIDLLFASEPVRDVVSKEL